LLPRLPQASGSGGGVFDPNSHVLLFTGNNQHKPKPTRRSKSSRGRRAGAARANKNVLDSTPGTHPAQPSLQLLATEMRFGNGNRRHQQLFTRHQSQTGFTAAPPPPPQPAQTALQGVHRRPLAVNETVPLPQQQAASTNTVPQITFPTNPTPAETAAATAAIVRVAQKDTTECSELESEEVAALCGAALASTVDAQLSELVDQEEQEAPIDLQVGEDSLSVRQLTDLLEVLTDDEDVFVEEDATTNNNQGETTTRTDLVAVADGPTRAEPAAEAVKPTRAELAVEVATAKKAMYGPKEEWAGTPATVDGAMQVSGTDG
jgi:hypothetical protein